MSRLIHCLRLISVILFIYTPIASAIVQEPDPGGTTVKNAFDFIVGGSASDNVRYLIVGTTLAIAFVVMVYAIKSSFEAMTEGQISKKAWVILLIRSLAILTMLNTLVTL